MRGTRLPGQHQGGEEPHVDKLAPPEMHRPEAWQERTRVVRSWYTTSGRIIVSEWRVT